MTTIEWIEIVRALNDLGFNVYNVDQERNLLVLHIPTTEYENP